MTNPFVFTCITPHGLPIIEELSKSNPNLMSKTRASMVQLGAWMKEAKPDTLVFLTPHGLRIDGQFCVGDASFMSGEMSDQTVAAMVGETTEDKGSVVRFSRTVDRELARQIIHVAKLNSLPVGSLNFQTSEGVFSNLPLDWGVMVPMYFMPEVPIVVVTPSRTLSFEEHIRFGQALGAAVAQSGKRVGLIASCDWSHAHSTSGPYGYHEDAPRLDAEVVDLLKQNDIEGMTRFSSSYIENAKPDGIWQSLILAGAIPPTNRKSTFLSYEVPTYFGLMCVAYHTTEA